MPKLGRSYTVDVLVPENGEGELLVEAPDGFTIVAGGRGAIRVTARDRDKFGRVVSLEHLMQVLGQVDAAGHFVNAPREWAEVFKHG